MSEGKEDGFSLNPGKLWENLKGWVEHKDPDAPKVYTEPSGIVPQEQTTKAFEGVGTPATPVVETPVAPAQPVTPVK